MQPDLTGCIFSAGYFVSLFTIFYQPFSLRIEETDKSQILARSETCKSRCFNGCADRELFFKVFLFDRPVT